jgi:uncharacterized protein (UPF0333 family)
MDIRGQMSIELLLILGFILIIVLMVASLAGPQIEENSITSAARQGASNALYEITSTNVNIPPSRVTKLNVTGTNNVTIKVMFSNNLPGNYTPFILNRTMQSILNQSGFTMVNNTTVKGNSKYYTIIIG